MMPLLTMIVGPLLLVLVLIFAVVRLRLFSVENVAGRLVFVIGTILVGMAVLWQLLRYNSGYGEWFLVEVYFWIDLIQFVLAAVGVLLLGAGLSLYSDFWQVREENMADDWRKLDLLDNLQRDGREPYQIMELLNIALKEILASVPESAGAVFLVNRQRRQLVLTSALGVSQKETALLEHYPFDRNKISQAIDQGDPVLGGALDLYDRDGKLVISRFQSTIVLPLVSQRERLGAIVLFTETVDAFSSSETRFLAPVAEWIAEKVHSARLGRELSGMRKRLERDHQSREELMGRLNRIMESLGADDPLDSFCQGLVGLYNCQSAHLVALVDGGLDIVGGNEPFERAGENYRTALIDALGRNKPLIVNQEGVAEDGRSYIAHSTLVYPTSDPTTQHALLLRRSSGQFKVSEDELELMDLFARLATMILKQNDSLKLDITRRKGLRKILRLLQFDARTGIDMSLGFLSDNLTDILPKSAGAVIFERRENGSFVSGDGCRVKRSLLASFDVSPGEGFIAEAANSREPQFAFGHSEVEKTLQSLDMNNRETFYQIFGDKGPPAAIMAGVVASTERKWAVMVIYFHKLAARERGEWERLITLALGLLSFRLTIGDLRENLGPLQSDQLSGNVLANVVNRVNNHLSAVVGNAELAIARPDLSGDVKRHFESIIMEAEQASEYVKGSLGKLVVPTEDTEDNIQGLNEHITEILERAHISGDLYMLGGRPREVELLLHPVEIIAMTDDSLRPLVVGAFNQFAGIAADSEVITISTYRLKQHVFLDISRHSKDVPGMACQAGFGEYRRADQMARSRPSDTFLAHAKSKDCFCSVDPSEAGPAYLSFKFPVRSSGNEIGARSESSVTILAIDDQTVILELITAMCLSLGYKVKTASSAELGIRLAGEHQFDAVLTDLAMPGASGLEVATRIKQMQPDTSIVLLTGWEIDLDQNQLERSGVDHVLHKPFRIEQLTDVLRLAVSRKSLS